MTIEEAAAYRRGLHAKGIQPGLSRMERAMELAGNPHKRLRSVHIAGTNGKGSTARMIQSMLTEAGYRVGLYTSPAVGAEEEMLTLDGAAIPAETLAAYTARWQARQSDMGGCGMLSEFELMTAIALEWFSDSRVDLCVLECGMGGRQDATNVILPPLVAVLTPIALDHAAFLGNTVEAVAAEKCGILKPPCRVVVSPGQSAEALAVIYEQAAARGLTVYQPQRASVTVESESGRPPVFRRGEAVYATAMCGVFQVDNALTALETVEQLAACGFSVDEAARRRGLAAAKLPCREETVEENPRLMLDAAHNPHAVAALAETIRRLPQPVTLVVGMLRDKEVATCVQILSQTAARVICCTPRSERALDAEALAKLFAANGVETAVCADPFAAARLARDDGNTVVVCGSFYTVGPVRAEWITGEK